MDEGKRLKQDRIYRAALHVIENIGMEILHESALTR